MVTFAARNHFPKAINFVFKGSLRFLPPLPTTLAVGVVVALELDLVVAAVARAFDLYFFPIGYMTQTHIEFLLFLSLIPQALHSG